MNVIIKPKMKEYGLIALAAVGLLLVGIRIASADVKKYSSQDASNLTRACVPYDAAPTTVSLSNVSAASSQLAANTVFYIVSTADVYLKFGSSAPTATTSHFLLPQRTLFPFATGAQSGVRYLAGILASGTGVLYILRCD